MQEKRARNKEGAARPKHPINFIKPFPETAYMFKKIQSDHGAYGIIFHGKIFNIAKDIDPWAFAHIKALIFVMGENCP